MPCHAMCRTCCISSCVMKIVIHQIYLLRFCNYSAGWACIGCRGSVFIVLQQSEHCYWLIWMHFKHDCAAPELCLQLAAYISICCGLVLTPLLAVQVFPHSVDCVAGCVQRRGHDCPLQGPCGCLPHAKHLEFESHLHLRDCLWPVPHCFLVGTVLHSIQDTGQALQVQAGCAMS